MLKKGVRYLVFLMIFSGALYLIGLGKMALTDPDEVFYAETAKEMLKRNTFLTPYIFGEPQFEKPPLYYWMVMLSFKYLGIGEFQARLPSALLGVFGIMGIFFLALTFFENSKTAFLSGLIGATSLEYIVLSRACVTDMALLVFILYAVLFFFVWEKNTQKRNIWFLSSMASLGLAVLTKGPVGLILPAFIFFLYLVFTKKLKIVKKMPLIQGIGIFSIIVLPWYILMYKVHGREFVDVFFGFHNIVRFLHPEHISGDVVYYYIPVIIGGFFPWSIFLPVVIWHLWLKRKNQNIRDRNMFLMIWFFIIFIFFTASRTKLPTYIFPLFPVLSILTAQFWYDFQIARVRNSVKKCTLSLLYLIIPVLFVSLLVFHNISGKRYPGIDTDFWFAGLIFVIFIILCIIGLVKGKYFSSVVLFCSSLLLLIFFASYSMLPEIGKYESSKLISEKLMSLAKSGEDIGVETQYRRGVAFYTDKEDIIDVHPHHIITKFLDKEKRVWCVIKEKNHIQLYTDEKKPYDKPTYVVYQLGKKVIITNRIPDSGIFIKKRTADEPY